jgi:hypothetical protein
MTCLFVSTSARAQEDSAAEAPAEAATEVPVEAAAEAPAEAVAVEAPQAAPEPEPEPVAEPEPAAAPSEPAQVNDKVAKLNVGGQLVFALAMQADSLKGLEAATDPSSIVDQARVAGAFSIVSGSWIDMQSVRSQGAAGKAAWVTAHEKLTPLKDLDPTDASAVGGKKKELLAALESVEALVDSHSGEGKGALKEGLAMFKLALDPPYAYGHSHRKIYAWTAASVGTMISMAGLGSLSNPLEREQGNFGWIATGVGLTTAGIGAALIVLDAK